MLWEKVHSKISEREADQPPVSSADIKNRKNSTFTYPCIFIVIRVTYFTVKNP
jgi:hypothetical protein